MAERCNLPNAYLKDMKTDVLYHLGFSTDKHDFVELFSDIKFVCMGGSAKRIEKLARLFLVELKINLTPGTDIVNLCTSDRFVMYKVGPVLCVNHGIGMPSLSIVFHEVFKLLYHAGCGSDVIFFRIGTSGGVGCDPGTVVITNGGLNGLLEPNYECFVLGKRMNYPVEADSDLVKKIFEVAKTSNFSVEQGKTMATDGFYESQGRIDGAMCSFTEADKVAFLNEAFKRGVRNIEMETTAFLAMTKRAGFKAAIVCVTLVNRLKSDQICTPEETLKAWEERPCNVVAQFVKKELGI